MSNLTDWTFADKTYSPVIESNTLTLCSEAPATQTLVLSQKVSDSQVFGITDFMFGKSYSDGSESYISISNSNEEVYGNYSDTVTFSMNFWGLGLPPL
jgi:hypothetical protein